MDPLTNPVVITFSALAPILVALLKQSGWGPAANAGIAFAVYIAVGVVGALASEGKPTLETLVPWVASVTVIGTVAYNIFWSKLGGSGENSLDARLTAATSLSR